jgi:hypothetical protein
MGVSSLMKAMTHDTPVETGSDRQEWHDSTRIIRFIDQIGILESCYQYDEKNMLLWAAKS